MRKKKRLINPNTVPNPVILPDPNEQVDTVAKDIKNDSSKVTTRQNR